MNPSFGMDTVPQMTPQPSVILPPNTTLVYDGNNYARQVFETDTSGLGIRRLFMDVYHNPATTIVVFDGKNAKEERRKVYPDYKAKRPPAPDDFYRVMNYWKELLMHTHAMQIEVPGFEADDVIAMLARSTTGPMQIRSTDRDYCVLVNALVSVPGAAYKEEIAAKDVRLYKTLCGDNSDNVPGVRLFGPTAWALLTEQDKTDLTRFLNGEQEWTHLFKRELHNLWVQENTPLLRSFWRVVDFLMIPPDQFQSGIKLGTRNLPLAEEKLGAVQQGATNTGHSVDHVRQMLFGVPPLLK